MKVVKIRRNAALKKDDEQNFWLVIEAAGSSASFNLTAGMANKVTDMQKAATDELEIPSLDALAH